MDRAELTSMLRCAGMWNYNAALGASSGSESRTPHTTADASPAKVGKLWPPSCTAFASLSADESPTTGRGALIVCEVASAAMWRPLLHSARQDRNADAH